MARRSPPKPAGDTLADLWPGQSAELLKALHILTREGRLNQDSRRKLKQVQHLVTLIRPAIDAVAADGTAPVIADLGAGKSYLGFLLYDAVLRPLGRGRVVSIERRENLTTRAQELAQTFGFNRLDFQSAEIGAAGAESGPVHVVTALHACDTATDDAIAFALAHEARFVALVPCCQAELAERLKGYPGHPLHELWRHPIHRREFGSHLTNVLRALWLEAHGYRVRVTEFVGMEHTLKNELIFAEKIQRGNAMAMRTLEKLLARLPARPAFLDGVAVPVD